MTSIKLSRKLFYVSLKEERDVGGSIKFNRKYWGHCRTLNSRPATIHRNNSSSVNIRMIEIKKRSFLRIHGISTSTSISSGRNSWKILSHLRPWTICFPLFRFPLLSVAFHRLTESYLPLLSGPLSPFLHSSFLSVMLSIPFSSNAVNLNREKRASG